MQCATCGARTNPGSRFCGDCGAALDVACAACGAPNPPDKRFCRGCGRPLGAAGPEPAAPRHREDGERRHLTVLFCDLVDSTTLASRLDPEDWHAVVGAYTKAATEAVTRFGGHVAKLLGDGVMAFFGYPEAHDDDAERAVRAGLGIHATLAELDRELREEHGVALAARVGIHVGSVVVRADPGREADVFGDVPNVAARVQGAAEPGSVVVTNAVHRLVSGLFVVESLGATELKGVPRPVALYRVVRPSGVRGRLQAAAETGVLTSFVGREPELAQLRDAWTDVRAGRGRAVLVIGEPGIGKSRLMREFRERLRDEPHTWIECAAGPFSQNVPYHAVTEMLVQAFAWTGNEPAEERIAALEGALGGAGLVVAEAAPLVAEIANLDVAGRYPDAAPVPDEQRRRRTLEALAGWALGVARAQPTVIAIEDLHWIDPSTLALLELLAERGADAPLLLLHTARPEFQPPWQPRPHHARVQMARLSDAEARDLVLRVAREGNLAAKVVDTVIDRTSGVPLFVEELTRLVLEQGRDAGSGKIPSTLHDSLLARLDRLGPAKEVAQVAAAIGRAFPRPLLEAVAGVPAERVRAALDRLVAADLVHAGGPAPDDVYVFKHALVQDVAYEALLRSRRRELHARIADAMETLYAASLDERVDDVAYHLWRAGPVAEVAKTVHYLGLAAERARRRGAFEESMRSYEHALAAVRRTPANDARRRQELDVALPLAAMQTSTRGYAAPERKQLLDEMLTLCEQLDDPAMLFMTRMQVWAFYTVRGDHVGRARQMAQQLHETAAGIPMLLMWAHTARGSTSYHMGDFVGARRHLEDGLALRDPDAGSMSGSFQDPASLAAAYLGLVLWTLGHPERALVHAEQAIEMLRDGQDFMGLANALHFASQLRLYRGEPDLALEIAGQTVAVSREHDMTIWLGQGLALQGAALTDMGRLADGFARLTEGIGIYNSTGAQLGITYRIGHLARAHIAAGRVELARELLDGVRPMLEGGGETIEAADLYRLRGDAWLLEPDPDATIAFDSFDRAIDIARGQEAKAWELRATTSRARALVRRGERAEARRTLRDVYAWFTEGLDTRDLRDARRLLDELA
jgi:class 3 adenylate cyclase/predicted ATPase